MPDVTKMKVKKSSFENEAPATDSGNIVSEPVEQSSEESTFIKILSGESKFHFDFNKAFVMWVTMALALVSTYAILLTDSFNDLKKSFDNESVLFNAMFNSYESEAFAHAKTSSELSYFKKRTEKLESELIKIKSYGCFAANWDFVKNGNTVSENWKSFTCEQGFWNAKN